MAAQRTDGPAHRLLAALAWMLGWLAALTPRPLLRAAGWCLGQLWFRGLRVRRRLMDAHLRAALPDLDARGRRRIGVRVCIGQATNVLEMLAWRRLLWQRPPPWFTVEGAEHLASARAAGPVIVASGHFGNFDLAACAEALRLGGLTVVSKRLSAAGIDAVWHATRGRFGIRAVPLERAALEALAALRAGEVVAMVLDQHAPEKRAVEAPFLGLPARTSAALATLAIRSKAQVVPAIALRRGGRHVLRYGPALAAPTEGDVRTRIESHTRALLSVLEDEVAAHPAQWLWLHRRWKDAAGRPVVRSET